MNSKPLWHCEKKLWPTCKHPQENHMTSLKTMQDVFWQLPLRGWVLGHVWAKKETADEWSARLSPLQEPNQDNMLLWLCYIFGINPLFSACWYITLWLCFCFGIYSPVEHCKAWSRCQHQLQTSWYHSALKVLDLIYCECSTWNQGDVALNNWGKTCMVLWRHIKLNREMQLDIKALCKAGNGPQKLSQ